jgi:hypothetical protein
MDYIFQTKVFNHSQIKKSFIDIIDLIPNTPIKNSNDDIFHSDYYLSHETHKNYFSLLSDIIQPHLKKMMDSLKVNKCQISSYWFQRYKNNGTHGWHTHEGSNYANVYFLECPKGYSTKFKHFTKDCEEGDILSFPAFLPHMSPKIEDDSVKTIISFNTEFLM